MHRLVPCLGRVLGRILLLLVGIIATIWLFGPREPVERGAPFAARIDDPVAHLQSREAQFDDITPGTEARAIWANGLGERADYAIVYLHGFSATSEEIRPVPDNVAQAIDAHLVFARLNGHGRGSAALAQATAGDWIDDAAEALAVARAMADQVIIVGTSTGATLAALAATEPDMAEGVAGIVMISPNFALANPAGRMLAWPGARIWLPWLVGAERSFEPQNDAHAEFWTTEYPTVAVLPMAALMREVAARDIGDTDIPLLIIFAVQDRVVSAAAARDFGERWGGPVSLRPQVLPEEGVESFFHVIAGDILSPDMTDSVTDQIVVWIDENLQ